MRVVGVDLGGTNVRAVLADERGNFLERRETRTRAEEGPTAVVGRIVQLVREVSEGAARPSAIGIAAPGPIDSRARVVSNPPNLPGWESVPLGRLVQERVGVPAFLGNDANIAALGEFTYGAGREAQHLIYITVSTGVGGGIISDGELLEGHLGAAGEVGHMVVDPEGPICNCGLRGHLEGLASGTALGRQAREAVAAGRPTLMVKLTGGGADAITARTVSEAAARGDELGLELMTGAARWLGYAVISLVHLFNPQVITIGGGVSKAGDLLFQPLREVVFAGLLPVFKEDLRIVPAGLRGDAGLAGAVALALRQPHRR